MKIFFILVILIGGLFFFKSRHASLPGTWVMNTGTESMSPPVLRIRMGEGIFEARLDMPDQLLYELPVSVVNAGDSLKVVLDEFGTCYLIVTVSDDHLTGRSVVDGASKPVAFTRVKARLPHPSAPVRLRN
jgi:hypothetical protein